jgi:VanZ family protein
MDRLHVDKLVHIFLFAVLVWLFFRAIATVRGKMTARRIKTLVITLLAAGIVYGLSIEFVQKDFIPNRSFDLWDVVADAVGSLIGLYVSLRKYKRPKGGKSAYNTNE